jgi:membrane-associated phospholipid phosphatase
MTRRILNSLLWATAIVATGSVLVLYDPALMAAYRSIAPKSQSVETLADFLTGLYEPYVLLAFAVLYAVVVPVLRWRRFSVLFGTMLTQALLIDFLKHVFSRVRPDGVPAGVFLGPQWHQWQHSFPGGHAAAAFALAAIIASWHPRLRWAVYLFAFLVALARIQLNRHYFGDCFIGAWLGYWVAQCFLTYARPTVLPAVEARPIPAEATVAAGD